jgi:nucleotide-binding universal stress UspA family protein
MSEVLRMKIEKILFATDFSEGSAVALPYAVDIAKQYGAKLYLVHVVYDITKATGWYIPHVAIGEIYDEIEKSARAEIGKIDTDEMKGFKDVEHVILKGTPYEEIIKFAEDNEVDLIVLGTHGRKGIDRVLFGSTAEQILRNAPCPVLSVRLQPGR